jgi:hypothetical protein
MNTVKFTSTALAGTGKKGILTPNAEGYYELVVGGLNVHNSAGEYYALEGAKELFTDGSSEFQRRVKSGTLRGEVGHPAMMPGQTTASFINRIMDIDQNNVCAHFKEVWLDYNRVKTKDGSPVVAIVALVIPSGVKADSLERSLRNPNENVCFSIRAFTADMRVMGRNTRTLKKVITFDMVNEPGIHIAEKYKSPSLESLTEKVFTREQILRASEPKVAGMALEASNIAAQELAATMRWGSDAQRTPAYLGWS